MNLWRKVEPQEQPQEEERTPHVPRALQCSSPWTLDTKYPHVDTMKALGIFEDVELILKNMHLAKLLLLSHGILQGAHLRVLSFNEVPHVEEEDRADLDQGLGWITFLAKGEKRMVTFRQLGDLVWVQLWRGTKWNFKEKELQRVWATIADGVLFLKVQGSSIRSPVLRYVHKALANTFFARKAPGQSTRGNSSFLTWESSPFSHAQAMARGSGEIDQHRNLMPSLTSPHLQDHAYNTRHQQGRKLSVGGLITPILCAAGVNPTDRRATEPGWMDIKFCKTNLIEHKELDGRFQFKFTHPLAGPFQVLLPNPELTTVVRGENIDFRPPVYTLVGHEDDLREEEPELDRAEDRAESAEDRARNADLGEPECYYFEEYEAPRMNPSVVAATRGLDFSKSSTNGKGKPWKDAKVHGQDGEQDQEFGEEGFWFFIKKKKSKAPTFPRSRSLPHHSKEAPCPRASQSLFFRAKGRRDNTQRRRKSSKARRSSSTTGLDRVQTEETQLDRADGRVGRSSLRPWI
ncbi:unnamed protein product [Microthlaspi erraticum]|uniref:Arabidopsis retrotransposon Orf1 C-terminal domain-containing protein n=1 Tax=Microthlaspi erraticum TaxID=1685480 RepID=A0A6D2KGU2_9BRAS|nr:unnamed protein product [Microthlaspi erraticum]